MEPTSGGLDHRTEPLELTTTPSGGAGRAARKPHRGETALLGAIVTGSGVIASIGFTGSYAAVRRLAVEKGFSWFSYAFPVGVDVGIAVILALDVYLTWKKMAFWPLRMFAWILTAGTIAFNASVSWPDPVGTTMHGLIPILFVIVVEAARHVVRRTAELADDRHMDSIRWWRWVLSPVGTFRLWRRMKLWEIRSYDEVVHLERARVLYRKELRHRYGRKWRSQAPLEALRPLRLASYGIQTPTLLRALDDTSHWDLERLDAAPRSEKDQRVVERGAVAVGPGPELAVTQPTEVSIAPSPLPENPVAVPEQSTSAATAVTPAAAGLPAVAEQSAWAAPEAATPPEPAQAGPGESPIAMPAEHAAAVQPEWQALIEDSHAAPAWPEPQAFVEPVPVLIEAQTYTLPPAAPTPQPAPAQGGLVTPFAQTQPTGPAVQSQPQESQFLGDAADQPVAEAAPVTEDLGPEHEPTTEQPADGKTPSKKARARLIYLEHQREGRELTRGQLAELAGYAHEGSARTVYNELEAALGPIVVRTPEPQLPVELASSGARA
jgi:hypothetical protein